MMGKYPPGMTDTRHVKASDHARPTSNMDRREFLRTSGAAAGASLFSFPFSGDEDEDFEFNDREELETFLMENAKKWVDPEEEDEMVEELARETGASRDHVRRQIEQNRSVAERHAKEFVTAVENIWDRFGEGELYPIVPGHAVFDLVGDE